MVGRWLGLLLTSSALLAVEPAKSVSTTGEIVVTAMNTALARKQFSAARALAQEFAAKNPRDPRLPDVLYLRGLAELSDKQTALAGGTWRTLIRDYPRADATATALEQLIHLADTQQLQAARSATDGVTRLRSRPTEPGVLRRQLLEAFPDHTVTVRVFLRDAEANATQGKLAEAVADYRKVAGGLDPTQQKRLEELKLLATVRQPDEPILVTFHRAEQLMSFGHVAEAGNLYGAVWTQYRTAAGAEAAYRQGLCWVEQKKFPEAMAVWNEVQSLPGTNYWKESAILEMARTEAFQLADYDKATASYRRFLDLYPTSSRRLEAEYQFAGVLYLKHDYAAAKAQFAKFIADYPQSSVLTEATGYLAKCAAALQAGEEAARKVAEAQRKQATNSVVKPVAPPAPQIEWLAQGDAAQKSGDYRAAFAWYERIILGRKNTPEYEPAMYRAGQCLRDMGELQKAQRLWEDFLRIRPQSALADDTLLALGDLDFEDLDQPVQAQAAYQRLVEDFPLGKLAGEAKHRCGLALFRQGQWDRAKEIFIAEQTALGGPNPNAPPTELDRLITACTSKQAPLLVGAAGAKLLRGAAMLSKLEGQVATGDTFFIAKQYAKAIRAYNRVVRTAPGSEEAAYSLMQMGRGHLQLFNIQPALDCYRPFLKEYARSQWADDALVRAAVIYIGQLGDKQTGTELLRTIVTQYSTGNQAARALVHLATLARWDKNWRKAEELYTELLRRYPASEFELYVKTVALPELANLQHPVPLPAKRS